MSNMQAIGMHKEWYCTSEIDFMFKKHLNRKVAKGSSFCLAKEVNVI